MPDEAHKTYHPIMQRVPSQSSAEATDTHGHKAYANPVQH